MKCVSPLVLFFAFGCISPANIEPLDTEFILFVDGYITDQPAAHRFRIDRISKFTGVRFGGAVQVEENAQVHILDDLGTITPVEREISTFRDRVVLTPSYRTPDNFAGQVGRTYILEIRTERGEVYRSQPQLMIPNYSY